MIECVKRYEIFVLKLLKKRNKGASIHTVYGVISPSVIKAAIGEALCKYEISERGEGAVKVLK